MMKKGYYTHEKWVSTLRIFTVNFFMTGLTSPPHDEKRLLHPRKVGFHIAYFHGKNSKLIFYTLDKDPSFIQDIFNYKTLDSTNTQAKRLIKTGKIRRSALVITEQQSSGRGRGVHTWWSTTGSLTFTLVWEWTLSQGLAAVPLVIGFACREAVQEVISRHKIYLKWPNDLIADHRKLGGILCEYDTDMSNKNYLLAGIGINVNNLPREAPEELRNKLVSLTGLKSSPIDKESLLAACLLKIKRALILYRSRGLTPFIEKWPSTDYLKNKKIDLMVNDRTISGFYEGTAQSGGILIRQGKRVEEFLSGEVVGIFD